MSTREVEEVVVEQQGVGEGATGLDVLDEGLLDQFVGQAGERGVKLAGDGGLLQALTKRLLESALEGEITDHAGAAFNGGAGAKSVALKSHATLWSALSGKQGA